MLTRPPINSDLFRYFGGGGSSHRLCTNLSPLELVEDDSTIDRSRSPNIKMFIGAGDVVQYLVKPYLRWGHKHNMERTDNGQAARNQRGTRVQQPRCTQVEGSLQMSCCASFHRQPYTISFLSGGRNFNQATFSRLDVPQCVGALYCILYLVSYISYNIQRPLT